MSFVVHSGEFICIIDISSLRLPFQKDNVLGTDMNTDKNEYERLVWQSNLLAKSALMPFVNQFPDYGPIIDSDLVEFWDALMTISMTGVALKTGGIFSDQQVQIETKKCMSEHFQIDVALIDDYHRYVQVQGPDRAVLWSTLSASWVAGHLRHHEKATAELVINSEKPRFMHRLSAFMNVSFGSTEAGFAQFFVSVAHEVETRLGISMGIGTDGAQKDFERKIPIFGYIFESFAQNIVETIAKKEK